MIEDKAVHFSSRLSGSGFAQLTYDESLREIETGLRAMQPRVHQAGFRARIARSTLADANEFARLTYHGTSVIRANEF